MAKPTDIPRWADTVAGDPAKVNEPPNAKKDVGWVTAEKPPAQWLNWLAFTLYTWIVWLRDFEITAHVWTALQTLNFGIVVTQGTANSDGTTSTGNGTGAGVRGRGGVSGPGVRGTAGSGATTAPGVHGQGDTTGAAGGPGVLGEGGTNGAGGTFTGNGTAPGVLATGGATNGNALNATGTGTGHALQCLAGGIRLDDPTKTVAFTSAKTYTRSVRGVLVVSAAEWTAQMGGHSFTQDAPTAGGTTTPIPFVMDVPAGATITSISWRIDPAAGHAALPGTMPELVAVELDPATGGSTAIVNQVDTSGSVAVYEVAHNITAAALSFTTTAGRTVVVNVYGEKGANEVDGLVAFWPVVTFTRATIGEE